MWRGIFLRVAPLSVHFLVDERHWCLLQRQFAPQLFPKKMSPRVSPNKTWVGTIGGGVLCLVAACILWHFFATYSLPVWLGFAVVVSFFGTLGDLFESTFKRCLNIKDSGKILPGHGGILDRFDSAMMAVPATYVYFMVVDIVNSL